MMGDADKGTAAAGSDTGALAPAPHGKALVLYYDNGNDPIFRSCFNASGVTCRSWCRNGLTVKARRALERLRIPVDYFDPVLHHHPRDGEFPLIIVFDTKVNQTYIHRLKRLAPSSKIVAWCWNEVSDGGSRLKVADGLDVWSYSPVDCERYGLRYNRQFYFDSVVREHADVRDAGQPQGEKAFVFMGRDKGRRELIVQVAEAVRGAGWGCEVDLLGATGKGQGDSGSTRVLPYEEAIERTLSFQGIIDVAATRASGPSLRAMESIFFNKKLITTNPVMRDCDFFDENNVFIWDGTNAADLPAFLERPYRPVPKDIVDRHLLSAWVKRFEEAYGL